MEPEFTAREWEFRDAPDGISHLVRIASGIAWCGLDCRNHPVSPPIPIDADYPREGVMYGRVQCKTCCRDIPSGQLSGFVLRGRGLMAIKRLVGMLLIMLAVQVTVNGVTSL
jgi:hypothetical protein